MPAIGMEDVRIPEIVLALIVVGLVYVMLLRAAGKMADESQICPVCGNRRDQAPIEHWRPGSRYCETCGRVTHRDTEAGQPVSSAQH